MNDLTQAQIEARDRAWEMLREHFDCVILAYDTEVAEGADRCFEANYHGGITAAIGLCERAKLRMMDRSEVSDVEEEE